MILGVDLCSQSNCQHWSTPQRTVRGQRWSGERQVPPRRANVRGRGPTTELELMNMSERSALALHGLLLVLAIRALTRLLPAADARRKTSSTTPTSVNGTDIHDHALLVTRVPAQRRSPYNCDRAPLDGSASPPSRPYLPAAIETRRRPVLMLTARFHLDLDTATSTRPRPEVASDDRPKGRRGRAAGRVAHAVRLPPVARAHPQVRRRLQDRA